MNDVTKADEHSEAGAAHTAPHAFDESRFTAEFEDLIRQAEDMRLKYVQQYKTRANISMTLSLIFIVIGGAGFGWFFLMQADLLKALASLVLTIVIPLLLNFWSEKPLSSYTKAFKTRFMPRLAKALGNLQFHPSRGISEKILSKTGVVPAFGSYEAEDCFMGRHKGNKLIFSEAQLTSKNKKDLVFSGIFVLLELQEKKFSGHTIVTADKNMAQTYAGSRWQKLRPVDLLAGDENYSKRFVAYSSAPEEAQKLVNEKLLKELSEASDVFDSSLLTATFFRGKYVFMMIPYPHDMFEASNIYVPVTTRDHALTCKQEIERIIEIIDIVEIYENV